MGSVPLASRRSRRWSQCCQMIEFRSRPWVEEGSAPPADLRLVPAALAMWAGSLIGLFADQVAWWVLVRL